MNDRNKFMIFSNYYESNTRDTLNSIQFEGLKKMFNYVSRKKIFAVD